MTSEELIQVSFDPFYKVEVDFLVYVQVSDAHVTCSKCMEEEKTTKSSPALHGVLSPTVDRPQGTADSEWQMVKGRRSGQQCSAGLSSSSAKTAVEQPQQGQPQLKQTEQGKRQRKRIPGSEIKRRRKAKLLAAASAGASTSTVPDTKKRIRSDESSASPQKPAKRVMVNRPKQAGFSYKDAATRHLRVLIVDRSNLLGKLSEEQANKIMDLLQEELDKALFSSNLASPPTFRGCTYSGELLRITCENETTRTWLKSIVTNLSPWDQARLDVIGADELPKLSKAAVFVPGSLGLADTSLVIRRLAAQNPWVKVNEWCVFHNSTREQPRGRLLVFGILEADGELIKERGGRLNYSFSALNVNVRKSAGRPADTAEAVSSDTPSTSRKDLMDEEMLEGLLLESGGETEA